MERNLFITGNANITPPNDCNIVDGDYVEGTLNFAYIDYTKNRAKNLEQYISASRQGIEVIDWDDLFTVLGVMVALKNSEEYDLFFGTYTGIYLKADKLANTFIANCIIPLDILCVEKYVKYDKSVILKRIGELNAQAYG